MWYGKTFHLISLERVKISLNREWNKHKREMLVTVVKAVGVEPFKTSENKVLNIRHRSIAFGICHDGF